MLVTSLTSAIAFYACSFTVIMPLKSFGIFASLIVPMSYILTIIAQPIVYYIYEMYFINFKLPGLTEALYRYIRLQQIVTDEVKQAQHQIHK